MQNDENTNKPSGCQSITQRLTHHSTHTHKVELISPRLRCFFLTLFTMYQTRHELMQMITPWKHTRTQKCIKLCKTVNVWDFFSLRWGVIKKKKNKAVIFHFHMKTLSFCHDQSIRPHVYSTYRHCPNCKYEHGHQVKSLAERKHRYINTRGGVHRWFSTLLIELWLW